MDGRTIFFGAALTISVAAVYRRKHNRALKTRILVERLANVQNVHIRDVDEVVRKLGEFVDAGKESLQVIADFDHTVTKRHTSSGKMCYSSHALIEKSSCMENKAALTRALFEKYYPLEQDHKLTEAERDGYMVEWWQLSHGLMVEARLHRSMISKAVEDGIANGKIELRENMAFMFSLLHQNQVPTLVFSAGVQDIVCGVLSHYALLTTNVVVVSNAMKFSESDELIGFDDFLIHSGNKTYSSVKGSIHDTSTQTRDHVLVIGDNLGDANMANGMEDGRKGVKLLKVGFLNTFSQGKLVAYQTTFDIVITHDSDSNAINALIDLVVNTGPRSLL